MKEKIAILLSFITLLSCTEATQSEVENVDTENTIVEEIEEVDVIEEQAIELSLYQLAREKHLEKEQLPQGVVLQNTVEVYDKDVLRFEDILKTTPNWFLCKYIRSEGEVEEFYYFTFDYNGNQLDAGLVLTFAEDRSGSISFVNDSFFVAKNRIDEVELDEYDNINVLSSKEEIVNYSISHQGKIIKQ